MTTVTQRKLTIYVERASGRWIVRDVEGTFWIVPAMDKGWEHREPFFPTDETELQPVPAHYKYLLGLSQ